MGCFAYCIFGSTKDITVGPTAIMAIMTAEHASNAGPTMAVLLTFLSGLIILLLGLLQLGFVIDFISVPVTAGFTSAAAITIASTQLKSLFGLDIPQEEKSHIHGIVGPYIDFFTHIDSIRWTDSVLGITCLIVLLLMRSLKNVTWLKPIEEVDGEPTKCQNCCSGLNPTMRKILAKVIWVVSTARNAIVVIVCLGLAYGLDPDLPEGRNGTFILTGEIVAGLPPFQPPAFSTNVTTVNGTSIHLDFGDMVSELGSAIAIIPLISILESVAIAKAFSGGKPVDASQEMIALGVCNFLGSFVSSMPTTGSFSRTAVNAASGVKTQFGGIYTGILVILALAVLMPACAYIPKATLAAVIITAVIFMVEYEVIKPMWRSKSKISINYLFVYLFVCYLESDLFCFAVSFICCLFWALEFGILIGVGVQVFFILYNTARPKVNVEIEALDGNEYVITRLDRALVFPSVSYVRNVINKAGLRQGNATMPVVIDAGHIFTSDFTAAKGFKAMVADFEKRDQHIIFVNLKENVARTFNGVGSEIFVIAVDQDDLKEKLTEIFNGGNGNGIREEPSVSVGHVDPLLEATDNEGQATSTAQNSIA